LGLPRYQTVAVLPAQAAARAMLNGLYPKAKGKAKAKPKAGAPGAPKNAPETRAAGENTA
jgi:hypothetical protein